MSYQHRERQGANKWTEGRASLILEVLSGMRIVKYFSYEQPFLTRELFFYAVIFRSNISNTDVQKGIYENRANELKFIQYINLIRSAKWVYNNK